jgi:hypothetical protein
VMPAAVNSSATAMRRRDKVCTPGRASGVIDSATLH